MAKPHHNYDSINRLTYTTRPDWRDIVVYDSEVEQVPYRKIDWWKAVSVYGSAFVCGALWVAFFWLGGFVSHWVLSPFN